MGLRKAASSYGCFRFKSRDGVTLAFNISMLLIALSFRGHLLFLPFTAAIVYYVGSALEKHDQVKGQSLITIGMHWKYSRQPFRRIYLAVFDVEVMLWLF